LKKFAALGLSFFLSTALAQVALAEIAPASSALPAPTSAPQSTSPQKLDDAASKAWGFDKSDIAPDAAVRFGVLPNGMKYAVMRNATPLHSASVRLRFDVGRTAEADDQQGLAHFIEHMAFNGSTRIPEGEMIKLLERNGLAFGADTNASTGFSETIYKLDLPQVNDAIVDTSLLLMRETASELLFDKAAIDRERGIILSEDRVRNTFGRRRLIDQFKFLFPGTPIANRITGVEAVVRNAPPERLRDLYDRFYTPERATLIFVGDIDPAKIETKIVAKFGDWRGKKRHAGDPTVGTINPNRGFSIGTFVDPDVPTSVEIAALKPFRKRADTVQKRKDDLILGLANTMLNRRLARISRRADAPFAGASASSASLYSTAEIAEISMTAKDRNWQRALTAGEQELRRALQHGFTEAELQEQLSNYRTALKNAVAQASTRQSAGLANGLIANVGKKSVFSDPQSALSRFEVIEKSISASEVTAKFREMWQGTQPLIYVSHDSPIMDADKSIARQWAESTAVAVLPYAASESKQFAHTNFGPAGTITGDKRITDFDIRTIRFSNNVMLNLKKTDFEKGRVRVSLRLGGGFLELPKKYVGQNMFMSSFFGAGGTAAHSADELQSILAGKAVSGGISVGTDAFEVYKSTTPADLELQLQLLTAYIAAPGFRTEAEAQWRAAVDVFVPQLEGSPQGVAQRDVGRILANGDERFGFPSAETLKARNFSELKPIVEKSFASAPLEIAIVGDIDEAAAIALVAKTFGALPTRAATRPDYAKNERVRFPAAIPTTTLRHGGKPNQGLVQIHWPTTDDKDAKLELTLDVLSEVMGLMMTEELREKLGATYSPSASSFMSGSFKRYGFLSASSSAEPQTMDTVFTTIDKIAATLSKEPVSADLLKRARAPLLENLIRQKRENGFWLSIADEAQTDLKGLNDVRKMQSQLEAITVRDLQLAAKKYLLPKAALRIRIEPKAN
jgi:zinc protease